MSNGSGKSKNKRKATTNEAFGKKVKRTSKSKNNTRLPDDLKAGVENLSGLSMDDVNVHNNSSKPAQLNEEDAGIDIHLAPGQTSKDAWHVVQQKLGRLKPKGKISEIKVNDDQALEKEADKMGRKARRRKK
jgi:hypothetical protein